MADPESQTLRQEDIEALMKEARTAAGKTAGSSPASGVESLFQSAAARHDSPGGGESGEAGPPVEDIELLLHQAERALASIDSPGGPMPSAAKPFKLEEFAGAPPSQENATLELLRDVELDLKIELGRTNMYLEDVLRLRKGAVVPLDKLAGDPVDIYVNGRLIARGEVLVLNDNFCVRVAELISSDK
jgi:flagellar motor switch protein FliN/FliY